MRATGRLGNVSRGCGCELFVWRWRCEGQDGEWRFVCVFHEVADELLGVVSRATCGLQDEWDEVDVWISVKFDLLCLLAM